MFFYYLCAQIASKSQILAFILMAIRPSRKIPALHKYNTRYYKQHKKHSSYELFN